MAAGPLQETLANVGQSVRVRILARDVSIALEQTSGTTSIQNCLPATVEQLVADYHPALSLLRLRSGASTHTGAADTSLRRQHGTGAG